MKRPFGALIDFSRKIMVEHIGGQLRFCFHFTRSPVPEEKEDLYWVSPEKDQVSLRAWEQGGILRFCVHRGEGILLNTEKG